MKAARYSLPILLTAAAATAVGGFAQSTANASSLKSFLNLTDAQVESIQSLRRQQGESLRTNRQSMMDKARQLREAMRSGTSDANTLGQLMVDLQNMRKEARQKSEQTRASVLSVLTPEQKAKLKTLEDAQALQSQVRQAQRLGLLGGADDGSAGPGRGAFGRRPGRGGDFGPMRRGFRSGANGGAAQEF